MIRLLRIEARRGPTPLILPLLAVLLGITPLARNLTPVALWLDRSVDVEGSVQMIGPFAAGAAAWLASRGARRHMDDLLASTARNPLATAFATWLATVGWMVAFYVALAAAYLGITAGQATWGTPLWWPVITGLVAVVVCSLIGFVVGQWFPSRLTAPLATLVVLAVILGVRSAADTDRVVGIGLLSPIYPTFGLDASVFYQPQPDLAIVRLLLYTGILGITLAAMLWHTRNERPALRPTAVGLLAAGLALTTTAGALDATARNTGTGIVVPAFHTTDPAIAFTPVCSDTPFPVCVHPAYDGGHELSVLSAVIDPIVAPVRGIPGMPVRAEQTVIGGFGVRGDPPVLPFDNFIVQGDSIQPPEFEQRFEALMALSLFTNTDIREPTGVQRALAIYVLQQAHDKLDHSGLDPNEPAVAAAAHRFAELSPTARNAWLATHLAAIRAGHLTVEDLP
jgi:hypothetical protein